MTANAAGPVTTLYLIMAGLPMLQFLGTAAWFYLVVNAANRYHGPALSQALSWCASNSRGARNHRPWFWLLDSDCVVARPDAATEAMSAATAAGAALLGEAAWNRWHEDVRLCGYSLLLDPAYVWRPQIGPFGQGGGIRAELVLDNLFDAFKGGLVFVRHIRVLRTVVC